MQDELNNFLIY